MRFLNRSLQHLVGFEHALLSLMTHTSSGHVYCVYVYLICVYVRRLAIIVMERLLLRKGSFKAMTSLFGAPYFYKQQGAWLVYITHMNNKWPMFLL